MTARSEPDTQVQRRVRLATLLEEARTGKRDALGAIVAELTPLLWHVARVQGLDRAACEDVVQTTWLCLLRELHAIRAPQALVSWLVTVARREAARVRDGARRERPTAEFTGDDPAADDVATAAEERLANDERGQVLWAAVEGLPRRCRDLLRVVAFVDRPDYERVAVALGMPRGSIGPTRGRCLAKLREVLAAQQRWSWP